MGALFNNTPLVTFANSHVWVRDTFVFNPGNAILDYRLLDLRAAALAARGRVFWSPLSDWKARWNREVQGFLYKRERAPGEDYWWG